MTPTTSKLGADMTKTKIESLIAKLRKLVPAQGEWTSLAESACGDAADALELLVGQPAAIDKQEIADRFIAEYGHRLAVLLGIDGFDIADRDAQIKALLANEASKPAPSVEQDERGALIDAVFREHAPAWFCDHAEVCRKIADSLFRVAASTSANVARGAELVHLDDWWVDLFAKEMKAKLENARSKGRGGWQDCPPAELSRMLREHVEKGDPRDVANFCMFLWALRSPISAAPPAQTALTGRVLTYRNQPDNVGAWRLGEACRRAADLPAGDYIDRGLGLLKELQAKGFGVIALTAAQSASGDQS